MKLLYYAKSNDNDNANLPIINDYEFQNNDDLVTVKAYMQNTELTFDIDIKKYAGKVMQVNYMTTFGEQEILFLELYSKVDKDSYKNIRETIYPNINLLRFVVSPDMSDVAIFPQYPCTPPKDGFIICELEQSLKSRSEYLAAHSEFFATVLGKYITKSNMLKNIDLYATVTYLESQVDTLTRIVKLLLANTDIRVSQELLTIINSSDKYSVLDIKPFDKIVAEFAEDKENVRELQTAYYKENSN